MSVELYDNALTEKLQKWIRDPNLRVLKPEESTRLFQQSSDLKNDKPLVLPLIALSRDKNIDILETTKQVKTFQGAIIKQNEDKSILLNVIPIKLSYQLDIYTKKLSEGDEHLRNFIFNLINYPSVDITLPYNGVNFVHRSSIQLEPTVNDNSDIKEHLFTDQFTRFTIRFSIDDAYLFSIPIVENSKLESIEIDVQDRTDGDIIERDIIDILENK